MVDRSADETGRAACPTERSSGPLRCVPSKIVPINRAQRSDRWVPWTYMGETMTTTAQTNESNTNRAPDDRSAGTIRDGLVGGVVAVLLTFLPLSTVLGGGIAGYLQARHTNGASARAGALAGGIAFIPHIMVGTYLVIAPDFVPPGPNVGLAPEYLLVGIIGFGVIYAIGLGVLGGLLGRYVRREHVGS